MRFLLDLKKDGLDPQALRDRPVLAPHLSFWKTAFNELTASRAYSQFGHPMPIQISEMLAYCEFFGIKEPLEREVFFRHIRTMDNAYVETIGERLKTETVTKPSP